MHGFIKLSNEEKKKIKINRIKIESAPALKIGKLAVDIRHERRKYGFYLLWLALAIATDLNNNHIACRFLVLDADVSVDKTTVDFYRRAGFKINEQVVKDMVEQRGPDLKNISMRYDILFNEDEQ